MRVGHAVTRPTSVQLPAGRSFRPLPSLTFPVMITTPSTKAQIQRKNPKKPARPKVSIVGTKTVPAAPSRLVSH